MNFLGKNKINIVLLLFLLSSIIIIIPIYIYLAPVKNTPVLSKYVGSDSNPTLSKKRYTSLQEIVSKADLVVIGQVITEPSLIEIPSNSGKEMAEKTQDLFKKAYEVGLSSSKIKIDKVIYGDKNLKEIELHQQGKPENDMYETKVVNRDKMLLMLIKVSGKDVYRAVGYEDGLIKINGNKVYSLSNNYIVAKYDNMSLDALEKDIHRAILKK